MPKVLGAGYAMGGKTGLRDGEVAAVLPSGQLMPIGRLATLSIDNTSFHDEHGEDKPAPLSTTGTITLTLDGSKETMRFLRKIDDWMRNEIKQLQQDILTDRIVHVHQDEFTRLNDEEREARARKRLADGEFRLCHAASARKHKKKRDRRVWWHPKVTA
jgi:hypothetical protein